VFPLVKAKNVAVSRAPWKMAIEKAGLGINRKTF
jgi:hypothetical protein